MNYEQKYKEAIESIKRIYNLSDYYGKKLMEKEFPELKESEDERIRKSIIDLVEKQMPKSENKKRMIALLEKQGEKELTDEVKPKFNNGDWITNGEYTWKVTDIKPLDYILQSQNGDTVDDTISHVDEYFHLWTIQDAKDGDVLSSGNPFIFRGFGDKRHPNNPTAYCGVNSLGTFILTAGDDWWTANDVHPATKEQRELLFQKMKEAGYEWDDEKKELKKISAQSSWSEEDERIYNEILDFFLGDYETRCTTIDKQRHFGYWLKSHKDRVQSQSKQEWSEEDEKLYISALWHIKNSCGNGGKDSGEYEVYNWLKSLKDRVCSQQKQEWSEYDKIQLSEAIQMIEANGTWVRSKDAVKKVSNWLKSIKPNHWKPTEKQMEALRSAMDFDWQSFRAEAAKDILCALIPFSKDEGLTKEETLEYCVKNAVFIVDKLISKLKEKEEK